jgi:hypothetical protein
VTNADPIEDRDALYYPFIHLRDEAWLRQALLFFPHVLRMTPPSFELNDSPFVRELAQTKGRRGEPLVGAYPLDSYAAYEAGERLAARFTADIGAADFREKYDRAKTAASFCDDSVFQIHRAKFAYVLEQTLREAGLIWEPSRQRGDNWIAVHPVIGEIVMSTAAMAAARDRGCDVLTDTQQNHLVAATRDEDAIYAMLLGRIDGDATERRIESRELGDLVVATTLDLSALTAEDFAALSREREALFDFRQLLARCAAKIPAVGDQEARRARAKEAAEQIISEWEATRRTWGQFVKRAFRLDATAEAKDAATDLLKLLVPTLSGAGAGAATIGGFTAAGGILLGAVPGLAVGLVYYGIETWRDLGAEELGAPTRFLSKVARHGGALAAAAPPARLS